MGFIWTRNFFFNRLPLSRIPQYAQLLLGLNSQIPQKVQQSCPACLSQLFVTFEGHLTPRGWRYLWRSAASLQSDPALRGRWRGTCSDRSRFPGCCWCRWRGWPRAWRRWSPLFGWTRFVRARLYLSWSLSPVQRKHIKGTVQTISQDFKNDFKQYLTCCR